METSSSLLVGKNNLIFKVFFINILSVALIIVLIGIYNCQGVLVFTIGMFCLVFWTLTCFQCPLLCHHYTGEIQSTNKIFTLYSNYSHVWLRIWVFWPQTHLVLAFPLHHMFGEKGQLTFLLLRNNVSSLGGFLLLIPEQERAGLKLLFSSIQVEHLLAELWQKRGQWMLNKWFLQTIRPQWRVSPLQFK